MTYHRFTKDTGNEVLSQFTMFSGKRFCLEWLDADMYSRDFFIVMYEMCQQVNVTAC